MNNRLAEFERDMRKKIQIISAKRITSGDFSSGASTLIETMNELADNIILSETPQESKENLESLRNVKITIDTLSKNGQITPEEFSSLNKMLETMKKTAIEEFTKRGGFRKKDKLFTPDQTLKSKVKKQFTGSRKYATMATVAGVAFDSPLLILGVQWLQARKEKKEELEKARITQQADILKEFGKRNIRTEENKRVAELVIKQFKDNFTKTEEKLTKEQEEALKKLSEEEKNKLVDEAIKNLYDALSYEDISTKGKKNKPIKDVVDKAIGEIKSPEGRQQLLEFLVKDKTFKIPKAKKSTKRSESKPDEFGGGKVRPAKSGEDYTTTASEIEKELGLEAGAFDLKASASRVEDELGLEEGSLGVPEDLENIAKERIKTEKQPSASTKGVAASEEQAALISNAMASLLPEGEFYRLMEDFKTSFEDYSKNWQSVNTEKQVEDRDFWLQDIHDYLEAYMDSLGIKKGGIKKSKDEGTSAKSGGGILSGLAGGLASFAKGALPATLAKGTGTLTGVGGIGSVAGGLVLGAPIAALGLYMNAKWKEQQAVEDQEMASIVNSVPPNRKYAADRERLWKDFSKINGITRSQEIEWSKNLDYENRRDQINGLISKVRTGQLGGDLKQKWLSFLAAKRSGIPTKVSQPVDMPKASETIPSAMPMPSTEPTAQEITIPSAMGAPVSYDNIKLANENVDIEHLEPGLKNSLGQLSADYKAATGEKLQVNSGARTYEEQAALKRVNKFAASPDRSPHVDRGGGARAFDAQSRQINRAKELGLTESAGLDTPVKNEPWHVQRAKNATPTLASINVPPTAPSITAPQQPTAPTVVTNNNFIQSPDLRHYIDDPYMRLNNNNGIS